MIIYNITTKVHHSIDEHWLRWQKTTAIPAVMTTGLFVMHRILHLLEQDDSEGKTYAVQYTANSVEQYRKFQQQYAAGMEQMAFEKWRDNIISFQSVLEIVN